MSATFAPGQDVLVDFEGDGTWWRGEVLEGERSGYLLCRVRVDVLWDFGRASAHVDPEQIVAVRTAKVRAA